MLCDVTLYISLSSCWLTIHYQGTEGAKQSMQAAVLKDPTCLDAGKLAVMTGAQVIP